MQLSPEANLLLSDRNLQIGNICFQWSHLEFLLAHTIQHLLKVDSGTNDILTGGLDILPRCSMALALAHHLDAPKALINAIKAVRNDLQDGKKLQSRRNKAIHGQRTLNPLNPTEEIIKISRGKGKGVSIQSNADLNALGREIADTHKAFYAVLEELGLLGDILTKPSRIIARNA